MNNFKRRDFVRLSALGFAAVALELRTISSYALAANATHGRVGKTTELNWDAFLERLNKLADSQHDLPWDQKKYGDQVKQLLLQCNFPEFQNVKKEIDAYENKRPNWFESSSLHYESDFQVSLFQFEKGEYIPHHDHPNMTGVLNIVTGNILAKNYNVEEQLQKTREVIKEGKTSVLKKCTLREVGNESLKAGDVSILTAEEGNIHSIMPNEFTQLVDVFTPAYKHDTNAKFFTVNEDGFYEDRKNVFEAEYEIPELSGQIKTMALGTDILNQHVGRYSIDDSRYIKVGMEEGKLILYWPSDSAKGGEGVLLLPYEKSKFWLKDQDVRCTFSLNDERQPDGVTIFAGPDRIFATKVK